MLENEKSYGSLTLTENVLHFLETSPYLFQCLRFAALLHDVGHAPFSHSGEKFMISWESFSEKIDELECPLWLKLAFKLKISKLKENFQNLTEIKIRHEVYTLLIVSKIFKYDDEYLSEKMAQDICAILDLSVKPYSGNDLEKSGLQNLLHEIVSGEIDADRMDYLLRDSRECGIVYGYFDLGRILDSLGFYYDYKKNKFHLALRRSGLSAFEDFLRARWSMYQQVYFHKTVTACEAMLQNINKQLPHFNLPLDLNEYLLLDDNSFYRYIETKYLNDSNSYTKELLNDLIYNRKLWKRVYEECIPKNAIRLIPSLCPAILNFVQSSDFPSELIENSTNLTNFSPKGKETSSKNNLKIIIKDVHSLKYLEPVEQHSSLINKSDEEIIIRRIYVSRYKLNHEEINSKEIQKKISEKIINPDQSLNQFDNN
nr:HD domain-containing protein [Silvanigrella aquatica]